VIAAGSMLAWTFGSILRGWMLPLSLATFAIAGLLVADPLVGETLAVRFLFGAVMLAVVVFVGAGFVMTRGERAAIGQEIGQRLQRLGRGRPALAVEGDGK